MALILIHLSIYLFNSQFNAWFYTMHRRCLSIIYLLRSMVGDPDGVHLDPGGVHLDPGGVHLDPGGVHLDPDGVHLDPDGVHLEPSPTVNKIRVWIRNLAAAEGNPI